jgi:hypothetical protein
LLEPHFAVADTGEEEATAEDEEKIRKYGSQKRTLDDFEFTLANAVSKQDQTNRSSDAENGFAVP